MTFFLQDIKLGPSILHPLQTMSHSFYYFCSLKIFLSWPFSQIHYLLIPFLPSFSNPCSLDMCPMTYHLFPALLYLVFGFSCPSDIAPIQVQLWDYLAYRSIFVLAFCLVNSLPTVQSLLTFKKTIYSRPGRPYLKVLSMSKFISSCVNTSHWGKTLYVLTDQCQVTIVSHSQTTNFEMLTSNKFWWLMDTGTHLALLIY